MADSNSSPIVSSSPPPPSLLSLPQHLPTCKGLLTDDHENGRVLEVDDDDLHIHQQLDKDEEELRNGTDSSCDVVSSGVRACLTDACDSDKDEPREKLEGVIELRGGECTDVADDVFSGSVTITPVESENSFESASDVKVEEGLRVARIQVSIHDRIDDTKEVNRVHEGDAIVTNRDISEDDDDDFGDFDAFRGCADGPVEKNISSVVVEAIDSSVEIRNEPLSDEELANEFADFKNADLEIDACYEFASFDKEQFSDRCSDWAEVDGGVGSIGGGGEPRTEEGDEDEFGDFDCAPAIEETLLPRPRRVEVVDGFDLALTSAFPAPLASPIETEKETSTVETNSELDVWSHLCDVDTTNALSYQWSSSHSNRRLVLALRINSRNVQLSAGGTGWSPLVPAFASTLTASPLEPTKALIVSNDVDGMSSSNVVATKNLDSASSQDLSFIPQAQFDWSSSGLTNPLEDDTTSALLDLDFFLTNDAPNSDSPPPFNSLESELLDPLNSRTEPRGVAPRGPSVAVDGGGQQPSPMLSKILLDSARSTTMMQARTTRSRPRDLTDEAKRILDSLPDLSFLRSKVLMFPVRSLAP